MPAREAWELTNIYYRELEHSESQALLLRAYKILSDMNRVYAVVDDVLAGPEEAMADIAEPLVDLIVEVRGELRRRKMYDLADTIRDRLASLGIQLYDKGGQTEWRRK